VETSVDVFGMWACLRLAYPPVSNQEADWVRTDEAVEELLRQSDFYAIGIRDLVTFDESSVTFDGDTGRLEVPMRAGRLVDTVGIYPYAVAETALRQEPDEVVASIDDTGRLIQLTEGDASAADHPERLYQWYSTEKIILDRGRGAIGLDGFAAHREFATYELLYVGIAKKGDTYDRLFDAAHTARQSILTNEHPRTSGARVSDEMILFPFQVDPMQFKTIESEDDLTDTSSESWKAHSKKIVVDAEKAFIKLLDPQYNSVKYKQYPVSADGLWGHGYTGYGFTLAENITFTTSTATFVGSLAPALGGLPDNHADLLLVEGDQVSLAKGLPMSIGHM
jgi:hypothetical protein